MITRTVIALLLQLSNPSKQDSLFTKGILNESTAPYYVLITVVNDSTHSSETIATEAPFLLGAIHLEYNIPYSKSGSRRVQKIALSNVNRIFHFRRDTAIKNIYPNCGNSILFEVKKRLSAYSNGDLLKQIKDDTYHTELHLIYMTQRKELYYCYRNAVAQVLLERGILVGRGCFNGSLYSY
jgi:hypothetical protein